MDVVGQDEGRHEGAKNEDRDLDCDRLEAVSVRTRLEDVGRVESRNDHERNLMEQVSFSIFNFFSPLFSH